LKRNLLPFFDRINELSRQRNCVTVAIDGNSAAGKTYLAALCKSMYPCNVFSMDDFFLRPIQRTPDRLGEPGGNIDYERFGEEIIDALKTGEPFSYRPYNCQTMELSGQTPVSPKPLNVIEGVYSLHPRFINAYDFKVFMRVDEAVQRRRLFERRADLYERFLKEWIPMENRYFEHFRIQEICDLVIEGDMF